MIIDIEQRFADKGQELHISCVNKQGTIDYLRFPIPESELYEWIYSTGKGTPGIRSWDDKPVRKVKAKWLNKWRIEEFIQTQPKEKTDILYEMNVPKMMFCDIEVEVSDDGFPEPTIAKNPVTSIAFSVDNKIYAFGTRKLAAVEIARIQDRLNKHFQGFGEVTFKYTYFTSEYDMLASFFGKVVKKAVLLTGWNFIGFDWTYLINRCKRLNIKPEIASVSNKTRDKELKFPLHSMVVDYLDIFKKWDRTIDVVEHYTLDWVSQKALGIKKVSYNGTLQDLYKNDFETYIFYNAVDTYLVKLLHEKVNTMSTFLNLANITGVEAHKTFSPIWITEKVMSRIFFEQQKIFPTVKNNNKKTEKYKGGLVMKPEPGHYMIACGFDFKSLYPFIMMQWNISPESFIGMIADLDISKLGKHTKTASGAVFDNEKDSVYRTMLKKYYGLRKNAKVVMFEVEQEIEKLKALAAKI